MKLRGQTALDRRTILGLCVPGFQRQVLNMLKICRNDQRKRNNKGASLLRSLLTMDKMYSLASQWIYEKKTDEETKFSIYAIESSF